MKKSSKKREKIRELLEIYEEKEKILNDLLEVMCEGEMTASFIQKNLDDRKRNKRAIDLELQTLKAHKQDLILALTNLAHTFNDTKEQVFYMYVYQGLEISEIAFRLNINKAYAEKYVNEIEEELE